ncbi:xanthine dehydrogenase family protein subunit M [Myxococcota bacterium]|nr:xanthine dehydrogenase family protein subunit M [Myxococcota bacterium]
MHRFEYANAASLQAAQEQLKADGSVIKAGGIDLLDLLKEHLIQPARLVQLKSIPELSNVHFDPQRGLSIGPMLTLAQTIQHPLIKQHTPSLVQAAQAIATPQIRNLATLGGNLCQRPRCWYFRSEDFHCFKKGGRRCFAQEGENINHAIYNNTLCAMVHPSGIAGPLVALGASVTLLKPPAPDRRLIKTKPLPHQTQTLPIEDFFTPPERSLLRETILGPQDILTHIHIPPRSSHSRDLYLKQKHKESADWPLAEIAVSAEIEQGRCKSLRVVLGSAAPTPWRSKAVEDAILGKPLDDKHIQQAAKAVRQDAKPLAQNAYKLDLFETLVARALHALNHPASQGRP